MKEQMHKGLPWFGIPKLYPYLKTYGSLLFWMVFMGLVASGADVAVPLFQQYAIDHFIADKTMQGIWGFVGLYVLVIGFQIVSNYISAYGACKAELVVSDERIDYVKADVLDCFVAFNKPSFDKFKGDINPNTRVFVDSTFVPEDDVKDCGAKEIYMFPATQYAEENFRVVCTNIVMMGFFVAKNPELTKENALEAIKEVMNPKVVDLNLKAFMFGYEKGLNG